MTLIAAVATVATVAKQMQADEHDPDKDPNPVLCKPYHLSLPLRDCESIFRQIVSGPPQLSCPLVSKDAAGVHPLQQKANFLRRVASITKSVNGTTIFNFPTMSGVNII